MQIKNQIIMVVRTAKNHWQDPQQKANETATSVAKPAPACSQSILRTKRARWTITTTRIRCRAQRDFSAGISLPYVLQPLPRSVQIGTRVNCLEGKRTTYQENSTGTGEEIIQEHTSTPPVSNDARQHSSDGGGIGKEKTQNRAMYTDQQPR